MTTNMATTGRDHNDSHIEFEVQLVAMKASLNNYALQVKRLEDRIRKDMSKYKSYLKKVQEGKKVDWTELDDWSGDEA